MEREAAEERKRLGIKDDTIMDKLMSSNNEDGVYLALVNLWSAQYAPYDIDGYKNRLADIAKDEKFADAVNEILNRLN